MLRLLLTLSTAAAFPLAAQDARGSSDHPLFPNRMPDHTISSYQQQAFTSYAFRTKPPTPVEGKYTRISYYLRDMNNHPGGLAVRRNYENAIQTAGGQVVFSDENVSVVKAMFNGVEVWAEIQAGLKYTGRYYYLHIMEKKPMQQVITAAALGEAIDRDGFVALDIRFATGQAAILPESLPVVDQVAELLKARPALSLFVEGHTDNTGTAAANKTLSESRASSVAAALGSRAVAASRLLPRGYGQDQPVAANTTEDGRARNRRVVFRKVQ